MSRYGLAVLVALSFLLGLVPGADAAASRPDLVITSVSHVRGGKLAVTDVTKNRGTAGARKSTTAIFLSKDGKRSRDDVSLGSHSVKALKKKKSAKRTTSVGLPTAPAGTYRVLVCADIKKKVKESNEKNNCRAATQLITIAPAAAPAVTLTVTKRLTGNGTIVSSPAGIDCGATCSASFPRGTVVTLTATPQGNSLFTGWTGQCSGTGTCRLTMDAAKDVGAIFELPVVSVGNVGTNEGPAPILRADGSYNPTTILDYSVQLDRPAVEPVTVKYATVGGTATPDVDFESVSGQLTFAPGQTATVVHVRLLRDLIDEPTEDFRLDLTDPTDAVVMNGGTTTLTDEDSPCALDDPSSPDDTFALARDLTASSSTTLSDQRLCLNDADNFKVRVPAGQALHATVTGTDGLDAALGVYSGSEFVTKVTPLTFADANGGDGSETVSYLNTSGSDQIVIVRVASTLDTAAAAGRYGLQITFSP